MILNITTFNHLIFNLLADEVTINLDMFHSLVKYRIDYNLHDCLVVTKILLRILLGKSKLTENYTIYLSVVILC